MSNVLFQEPPRPRRAGRVEAGAVRFCAALVLLFLAAALWARPARSADDATPEPLLPPALPRHVTPETDDAIRRGLSWLAARQSREGFWSEESGYGSYPVSMTALAGLSMLASGSTPTQGAYAPNVSRAMGFLLSCAQDDGLISRGGAEETHSMYGHGFSMLFLAEAHGMEEDIDRQQRIARVLERAVRLTDRAQSSRGGWYYTPSSDFDEGSVTVTQVQGLRACRNVGVTVPKRVIDDAMHYLEKSALPGGGIAYRVGMTDPRPPITAAAVVCWYNAGQGDLPLCRRNLRYIIRTIGEGDGPAWMQGHFYYAHFYMAQAMYLSGDKNWEKYFPRIRDRLLATQGEDGAWLGDNVGKVYGTSLALMILQLPYQYLPIMQR